LNDLELEYEKTITVPRVFFFIFAGLAFSATPSFAKTVKACQEEWRANKAANEAAKITEKDFVAKCRTEAATPAATTTTAAPAAAPKPAAKKPADPKQAEYARERACGKEWKADKAAGKVQAGMTWPQYWSDCDKRKKAAGM
jgi:hypothetical protein